MRLLRSIDAIAWNALTTEHRLFGCSLLRIGLGSIVLYYLLGHWALRELLWGPHAVYPLWLFLRELPTARTPSLFALESPAGFDALYIAAIVVAGLYAVGWRTRWIGPFFYAATWSLFMRNPFLLTGGDNLLYVELPFVLLMNTSAYLSFDSHWRGLQAMRRPPVRPFAALVHNVALGAVLVQLCIMYGASGLEKAAGYAWQHGTALYYVLRTQEFGSPTLGRLIVTHPLAMTAMTYLVVAFELAFPFLIWSRRTQWIAAAAATALHAGIAVFMGLVPFAIEALIFQFVVFGDVSYETLGRFARAAPRHFGRRRARRGPWRARMSNAPPTNDWAPAIEQNRWKRAGTGLRACDPVRACPGFTLFAPMTPDQAVHLIDLAGNIVHTWALPYPPGYGYLTPAGALFFNGRVVVTHPTRFIERAASKRGAALEVDWHGRILWEVNHPEHHHDAIRLRNGNVMLLCMAPVPRDIAARVRGGIPNSEANGEMYADYLVETTTDGRVVWEWRSWEHLDPEADAINPHDHRYEWTHGNTVAEMPDGNIVLSFRHTSSVVIVDRRSGAIIWKLGPPMLAQQHAPTPLPNGNLLIFDNGTYRVHGGVFSRVIEVELATKRIVWSYTEPRRADFFAPSLSNARRLPNGNTLICEGDFGRLFEVTHQGLVVWEYVNPFFGRLSARPDTPIGNQVFRAFRYSAEEIARARSS